MKKAVTTTALVLVCGPGATQMLDEFLTGGRCPALCGVRGPSEVGN